MVSRQVVSSTQDDGTLQCKSCIWNKEGICTKMSDPDSLKHPTIVEARSRYKDEPCNVFVKDSFINVTQWLVSLCGAFLILSAWMGITYLFELL